MPNSEIEEFAKILVQEVRDRTIQNCDRRIRGDIQNIVAKRWKEALRSGNSDTITTTLVADIVDDTIFHLLRAIDQGLLRISFETSNAKTVNLPKDGLGELGGWYMGSEGWRAMFSRERFVDNFSDLK